MYLPNFFSFLISSNVKPTPDLSHLHIKDELRVAELMDSKVGRRSSWT